MATEVIINLPTRRNPNINIVIDHEKKSFELKRGNDVICVISGVEITINGISGVRTGKLSEGLSGYFGLEGMAEIIVREPQKQS